MPSLLLKQTLQASLVTKRIEPPFSAIAQLWTSLQSQAVIRQSSYYYCRLRDVPFLQCQPTFISLFSYCMFWAIIFACLLFKWKRGALTDADFKAKRRENKRRAALGLPPIKDMDELETEVQLPIYFQSWSLKSCFAAAAVVLQEMGWTSPLSQSSILLTRSPLFIKNALHP